MTQIFIIHGWSYNLDKWQPIMPFLKAQNLEPILLKVPGLTTPSDKVWDIKGYIKWLDGELKGEPNPIVIGHSNGGRIALSYAQANPGRLKQLILIDSAGLAEHSLIKKTKLGILSGLSKIGKPLARIPLLRKVFYKVIGAQDYYQAPPNMRETMQNMLFADSKLDLTQINLPTTLIWGREDNITPLKDGKKIAKLLPNSSLNIIDRAKHAPQATQPEMVAELIKNAIETSP